MKRGKKVRREKGREGGSSGAFILARCSLPESLPSRLRCVQEPLVALPPPTSSDLRATGPSCRPQRWSLRGSHVGGAVPGGFVGLRGHRGCGSRALPPRFEEGSSSEGQLLFGQSCRRHSRKSLTQRRVHVCLVSGGKELGCWLWDPCVLRCRAGSNGPRGTGRLLAVYTTRTHLQGCLDESSVELECGLRNYILLKSLMMCRSEKMILHNKHLL